MGLKDYDHGVGKWKNGGSSKTEGSKKNVSSANEDQPDQKDKGKNSQNRNYDEQ